MPTETRTFIGKTSTAVGDGYAGFRLNQPYQLTYERRDDGTVAIKLDHHEHVSASAGPMVVSSLRSVGANRKWFN